MANLTNKKGKFAIAIFCHFSPLVVFEKLNSDPSFDSVFGVSH